MQVSIYKLQQIKSEGVKLLVEHLQSDQVASSVGGHALVSRQIMLPKAVVFSISNRKRHRGTHLSTYFFIRISDMTLIITSRRMTWYLVARCFHYIIFDEFLFETLCKEYPKFIILLLYFDTHQFSLASMKSGSVSDGQRIITTKRNAMDS